METPPSAPGKDPAFAEAKRVATSRLVALAEQAMREADEHKKEPLGMALLNEAERHMNRLEKVQATETQESLEKALEEKAMDFKTVAEEQSKLLKSRRGLEIEFLPASPEITQEQLAVFHEVFGVGNLEPVILPTAEQFTEAYVQALYPATETEDDKAKGIVNHQPSYWNQAAEVKYQTTAGEPRGSVFLRSMKAHLVSLQKEVAGANPLILRESIIKPKYVSGGALYGSIEGDKPGLDSLLPIMKEVFGKDANRFSRSHDDLTQMLIPKMKEKLESRFKDKGLPIPNFKIIPDPSVSSNLATVLKHPESSQTDTWERASDILLDKDGKDSGRRLCVGSADGGGAGDVGGGDRGSRDGVGGFRLAVVLTP
ncbi:MAG: hypothetical protein Q7R83_02855 [bacterium]|nr:hypothetical protein [bacterium]